MNEIRITARDAAVTLTATLNDSATAKKIFEALPIESSANVWGDEVYFEIPVKLPLEGARETVPSGTVAYWPPGAAVCIFFGQKPYSAVNVIGKVDGDEELFAKVKPGDTIRLERV